MKKAAECLRYARECRELAALFRGGAHGQILRMAALWEELGDNRMRMEHRCLTTAPLAHSYRH
jgi:hypothetical protein